MASTPKAGDVYTFVGETPIGLDAGALIPGTVVTVREVVDAGEPGAHDDEADAVVVEWPVDSLVIGDDGKHTRGTVLRSMSIPLAEQVIPGARRQTGDGEDYTHPGFADLFTKGGK